MPAQPTIIHDQDALRRRLLTETALEHAGGAQAALERLLAYAGHLERLVCAGPADATLPAARDQLRTLRRDAEALAASLPESKR